MKLCIKCMKCGLPRNGHFDRKTRPEKRTMILQKTPQYPVAVCQLAAVRIQSSVRSYLVQLCRRRNLPIDKWQQKCVHYLSTKGPYGRNLRLDQYPRMAIYNRIAIYSSAALQIQMVWSEYIWLNHLHSLSPAIQDRNTIILQRTWRASVCRRFYATVQKLVRHPPDASLKQLLDPTIAEWFGSSPDFQKNITFRIGVSSSFPFALYYHVSPAAARANSEYWPVVDNGKFVPYAEEQIKLQEQERRRKISKAQSIIRHSRRDNSMELRRERIRKKNRRKFKWFYDRKEGGAEQPDSNHSKLESNSCTENVDGGDSDLEVMTWLRDLDPGRYPDDLMGEI